MPLSGLLEEAGHGAVLAEFKTGRNGEGRPPE